jgi:hypothetical protein
VRAVAQPVSQATPASPTTIAERAASSNRISTIVPVAVAVVMSLRVAAYGWRTGMRRGRAFVFATILLGGIGCARTLP